MVATLTLARCTDTNLGGKVSDCMMEGELALRLQWIKKRPDVERSWVLD